MILQSSTRKIRSTLFVATALAAAAPALGGCAPRRVGAPARTSATARARRSVTAGSCGDPAGKEWGYEDGDHTLGPACWEALQGDALCGAGEEQSPIDLTHATPRDLPDLLFAYRPSKLRMRNNGHTVQVEYEQGSTLCTAPAGASCPDDRRFTLAQFHFHAPSEHKVNGKSFPLEIHFVHVDEASRAKVVVGVLVEEGAANAALDPVFSQLPTKEGTVEPPGARIDGAAILPAAQVYESYSGSLTTPSCTEGLAWYVMESPIQMSAEQISKFTSIHTDHVSFAHTNRPVQPLGKRVLLIDSTHDVTPPQGANP